MTPISLKSTEPLLSETIAQTIHCANRSKMLQKPVCSDGLGVKGFTRMVFIFSLGLFNYKIFLRWAEKEPMGKFISAAHTSDFLITQITWLYVIVSPWWQSAPPSMAMALSWETEGWAAPSRLREGSCSKLWGIQVSWDLTYKWWEGAASAVIYVLYQTFTVEWAEHQNKAIDVLVHLYSHPHGQEIWEYYKV